MSTLSLTALLARLTSASTTSANFTALLHTHKDHLFRSITHPPPPPDSNSTNVVYRLQSDATTRFPQPTAAEEALIQSLESHLSLSRNTAANLVRDYLSQTTDQPLPDILHQCTDLTPLAPLFSLKQFWLHERRAAFATVTTVLVAAAPDSAHPFADEAAAFLAQHESTLRTIVLDAADAVLDSFDDTVSATPAIAAAHHVQPWWCMELLFAFCLSIPLSLSDREKLFSSYCRLSSGNNRFTQPSAPNTVRSTPPTLDGGPTSLLFIAAINRSNSLAILLHPPPTANDDISATRNHTLDVRAMKNLDNIYTSMRSDPSPETGLMAMSWSSYVRLRYLRADSLELDELQNLYDISKHHMEFAVSVNVFNLIQDLTRISLPVDREVAAQVSHTVWCDLSAFLVSFPPTSFVPSQVEDMVQLATTVLHSMSRHHMKDISTYLWEAEGTTEQYIGANSLLRISAGIYPQTYRPLIHLLTSFVVDKTTAKKAVDFLTKELNTVTELPDAFRDSILALDEDDGDIWEYVKGQQLVNWHQVSEVFQMVRPALDDMVFIQAIADLPEGRYRPGLPKGSIGISNQSSSIVTWIVSWNGFGAVSQILQLLLEVLVDQQNAMQYDDAILEELTQSASQSFKFIDRICSMGCSEVVEGLINNMDLVTIMTSIVAELADPGDRAKASWLTKVRQETLLTAAAISLASVTDASPTRAQFALERFEASKSTYPISMALNDLSDGAFPAVAAIGRVASSCLRGAFLSQDKKFVLSSLSGTSKHAEHEGRGACTSRVSSFLSDTALPLWLTSTARSTAGNSTGNFPYWLLPACSLDMFSWDPRSVLYSPVISSVFAAVVTATCDQTAGNQKGDADAFLFPALRSALAACYVALRERNKCLQERMRGGNGIGRRLSGKGLNLDGISEPTPFEIALQKPDVIHAMASLSSGSAPVFSTNDFFEACEHSSFQMFLPKLDISRLWLMYPLKDDPSMESSVSWRSWLIGMSARCLSLQFCCLSHVSERGDVIQVPWPTMHKSSFGNWRGGGDVIRVGYAGLIESGDAIPVLELLVTILACGQRAASRSLMAPRTASSLVPTGRAPPNANSSGVQQAVTTTAAQENNLDKSCEIISAVVNCLGSALSLWQSKERAVSEPNNTCDEDHIAIGQYTLTIAACVRLLRVAWESHSSKWFQSCWTDLKVWNLFSSLLRCEGGSLKSSEPAFFEKAMNCGSSGLLIPDVDVNDSPDDGLLPLVSKVPLSVDVSTAWKGITADVLQVFSSQIMHKTTEGLLALQSTSSDSSDESKDKLPLTTFQDESFVAFQSSFSEKWMQILFSPRDQSGNERGVQVSTPPGLEGDLMMKTLSSDSESPSFLSVEERTRKISAKVTKLFNTGDRTIGADTLDRFQRNGDISMKFGADYYFDVPRLASFLELFSLERQYAHEVLKDVAELNLELTRQDVQVEVVRAFSAIASASVFADSFSPSASAQLTYSSAQFGGKVCRFFCRVLVQIAPTMAASSHAVAIATEMSKLLAGLSARLSNDELEQTALTAVKMQTIPLPEETSSLSPVGQICFFIDRILQGLEGVSHCEGTDESRFDVIRWLLLTASKLSQGSSFSTPKDLLALSRTAMNALRLGKHLPLVNAASAVALSKLLQSKKILLSSVFDLKAMHILFSAISALSKPNQGQSGRELAAEIASVLVLIVGHGYASRVDPDKDMQSFILRQLSGRSVHGFIPPIVDVIPAYDLSSESRSMTHMLWCSCLQVAGIVMPARVDERGSLSDNERERRDILEFCCANLERISRDSLNISGDWASGYASCSSISGKSLTIAKIEEAELAAAALFPLAGRALHVRATIPEILHSSIAKLIQYVDQVTRLIRAEPLERWVRPITRRERERSSWLRGDGPGSTQLMGGTPVWNMSPVKHSSAPRSPTPPRRSPIQAVRAAVGDGRSSPVPPSPGFTPLQVPTSPGASTGFLSPLSPWGPYGSGLITESALPFGEEVSRSLIRGLASALAALRRFSVELDEPLFSTSMVSFEEPPGLGLLQNILHHAGGELQRGAEGERREQFLSIAENTLLLIVRHVKIYIEQGILPQGVKDELRKRGSTYVQRMRRIVPPPPATSIVHSEELDKFWKLLK